MTENNTLARMCDLPEYVIIDGMGVTYGTHARWEDAQEQAAAAVNHTFSGELHIMRGEDLLEIVQVGQEVLSLKIAGGQCFFCNDVTEVVSMPDGNVCADCAEADEYGQNVWNYLRS